MGILSKKDGSKKFKVFDGKSFEFYRVFFSRKQAKLRAEELKLSNDIQHYRVQATDDGEFILWIH